MKTRIALALLALVATAPAQAQEPAAGDTTIVTVNGKAYPLDIFRAFFAERLQQSNAQNTPQTQEQAFNEFMNLIVASQEGDKRDLGDNADVQTALALQRMIVLSAATLQAIARESDPTDEELRTAYDGFVEQSKRTEYKARHILVDDKDKAVALIAELDKNNGEGFETLAEENSLGPTAEKGGDLGWFDARRMVKPFADAVAQMEPGTYSEQPVQTQFGWHVIKLEEVRDAEPPSFEDAKPQIEAAVRRQKVAEALNAMREDAKVELNEEVVRLREDDADGDQ
jgi:peptidyl-prolyl cis-trans isomerase C